MSLYLFLLFSFITMKDRYDPYEKKFTVETYDYKAMYSRRENSIELAKAAGSFGLIFGTLGRQGSPKVFNFLQVRLIFLTIQ